ncbi:hypothetical protein [Ornithinimicrobium kibberense]|uniref:hypothetical protein n=1 Tax=Ornithinimicrobium kibberense TaxID=282060 RepID=UPI003621356D
MALLGATPCHNRMPSGLLSHLAAIFTRASRYIAPPCVPGEASGGGLAHMGHTLSRSTSAHNSSSGGRPQPSSVRVMRVASPFQSPRRLAL